MSDYLTSEQCAGILTRLIQTNSSQPEGNEKDVVDLILSMLPSNAQTEILDHGANRQSLIVKIPGASPEGGVAFVGHLDTVTCGDPAQWVHPPFDAVVEDGWLYGRGAADMKGGDASMLAAALQVLESGRTPREPIYFCFTADEEVGGMGALALSQHPALASVREFIIAEPTGEQLGLSEKGALWLRLNTTGQLAHGSRPEVGVNAVEWTIAFYQKFRALLPAREHHPHLGGNTVSVTRLQGGVMTNVIPDHALLELDVRTLPSVDQEALIREAYRIAEELQQQVPGLSMQLEVLNNRPPVETAEEDPFVQRLQEVCRKAGGESRTRGMYFYTDASQLIPRFQKPFVILGPGDDKMAHQTNERVEIASVVRVAQRYYDYLQQYYL